MSKLNLFKVILFTIVIACCISSAEELFNQTFKTDTGITIKNGSYINEADGEKSLCIQMESDKGLKFVTFNIDPSKMSGKKIKLSALVRGEDISKPAKSWLGGKLQLAAIYKDNNKKWYDAKIPFGTFEWRPITLELTLNNDLKKLFLNLGLQDSKGKIYFRNVKIETIK